MINMLFLCGMINKQDKMEKEIKVSSKVVFTTKGHINGLTGVVEEVSNNGYVVRLNNSPLKFFNLIDAKKDEVILAD